MKELSKAFKPLDEEIKSFANERLFSQHAFVWALTLFRTNFRRCHALLWFVTSSLASPFCVTPIAFSATFTGIKGHLIEKAIGVMHVEMQHPACCTAAQKSFFNLQDFFVAYNLHAFFVPFICWTRPCSRFAYGVSCLANSLKMRHGERGGGG